MNNKPKDELGKFVQSNFLIDQKKSFSIYEYRIFYQVLREVYIKESLIKSKLIEERTEEEKLLFSGKLSPFEKEFTIRELCKEENSVITIHISDFFSTWNINGKRAYEYIISILEEIKEKTSVFKIEESDEYGRLKTSIPSMFEDATYREGENCFQLKLTRSIIPHIVALDSEFTVMALKDVVLLPTASSIRLYELLIQYKKIGYRDFGIYEFCDAMHISDNYAKRRENLAARVIVPALNNIEKTNIKAEFNYEGRGKNTIIKFVIMDNKVSTADKLLEKAEEIVGEKKAADFLEFINEKIKDKKITNKKAYINKMLEDDGETLYSEFYSKIREEEKAAKKEDAALLDVYYKKLRDKAENDAADRKFNLFLENREIRQVYEEIQVLVPLSISAALSDTVTYKGEFITKEEIEKRKIELTKKYDALLSSMGYNKDYLDVKYLCSNCKDTGYSDEDGSRCKCAEKRLKEAKKL